MGVLEDTPWRLARSAADRAKYQKQTRALEWWTKTVTEAKRPALIAAAKLSPRQLDVVETYQRGGEVTFEMLGWKYTRTRERMRQVYRAAVLKIYEAECDAMGSA